MTRTEENNKALEVCSHTIATEDQQTVILADISKSLAVIADVMSGAQEPEKAIDEAPTVETFTRAELESWLYQIAMNNLDGVERDKVFSDDCIELINRLDGFERYTKDKREGKI